jgi:hypothetical protein
MITQKKEVVGVGVEEKGEEERRRRKRGER